MMNGLINLVGGGTQKSDRTPSVPCELQRTITDRLWLRVKLHKQQLVREGTNTKQDED